MSWKTLTSMAALALISVAGHAIEIIHYDNRPATIDLIAGQERTVQFGDHVAVGVSSDTGQLLRVQSAQGAIHLRPFATFEKQRIQVKRLTDGRILLFDVSSRQPVDGQPPLEAIRVVMPDENEVPSDALTREGVADTSRAPADISPITLTRYAAQRFYAPQRLHEPVNGIIAQPLSGLEHQSLRVFKGPSSIHTRVNGVASFSGGAYHLAALMVVNEAERPITLDYLDLNVPFSHATLQHHTLAAAGQPGDRTMLYLVSDRPARAFLVPWSEFEGADQEVSR